MPDWLRRVEAKFARRIVAARLPLVFLASFSFCVGDLFGRAAGGDAYSYSGHSGSGGSDDDGVFIFLNLFFNLLNLFLMASPFAKMVIIIFILLVVVVYLLIPKQPQRPSERMNLEGGEIYQETEFLANAIEALIARDRNFNANAFLDRVSIGFIRMQEAWTGQDLSKIRQFTSDGVHTRLTMQLDVMKSCGIRNITKDVHIVSMEIAQVESDWRYDAVHVRIRASACDYYVDAKGQLIFGDPENSFPFTEIWSFLRKPGVKTLTGQGLYENTCPNCGQPLELLDSVACPSCKAIVNSGDYDWALAIITQAHLWRVKAPAEIEGHAELLVRDPDFNRMHLEDRAACMFYRYCESLIHASPKFLLKLSTAKFITATADFFKEDEDGERKFIVDSAIGGISTMWITRAGDFDVAMLKVDWIGRWVKTKVPCAMHPEFELARPHTYAFYLIRRQGALSSALNKLNSIHCPNCGAPDSISDKPVCEYCRTPLNDGSQDWTLAAMTPYSEQLDLERILPD